MVEFECKLVFNENNLKFLIYLIGFNESALVSLNVFYIIKLY